MSHEDSEIPSVPGRSFLTNTQREYLFGKDYSSERERQLRFQIRKNIQSALMDLQLIWNLSEKDRYQMMKPLAAFYEFDHIAEFVLEENHKELGEIDFSEGDEEIGGLMHQGIADLLTLYASYYGPDAFGHIMQQALNQATAKEALERGKDIGAYEIEMVHKDSVSEVID